MKNNVVFLHCTQDYSFQFSAANSKTELIARGLIKSGDSCVIHNGIVGTKNVTKNTFHNNNYSIKTITYKQYFNRHISCFFNAFILFSDLRTLKKTSHKNIAILELPDFHIFLFYIFILRILNYKIGVIAQEWGPTITTNHWLRKPFIKLYSTSFGYLVDFIFPISEFIINKIKHFEKPYLKVPILAEFINDKQVNEVEKNNLYVYCVFAAYTRVIFIIIKAFKLFCKNQNNKKLMLVLSGNEAQISLISDYILKANIEDKIIIRSKIPYNELIAIYKSADALLIPLDPDHTQDKARFSQKIAEYLSTGSPIITNSVGEINYYFENNKNIITVPYSVLGFCNALKWVTENREKAKEIGLNGFNLGLNYFDYIKNGFLISNFLSKI